MAKAKSSLLLFVVSIIFVVWGIVFAVANLLNILGGDVKLGLAAYAGVAVGWVGAVVELVAGVIGLKGKALGVGKLLAFVLIGLVAYNFILTVAASGFTWPVCATLVNLVLPILYCIGVDKATKK